MLAHQLQHLLHQALFVFVFLGRITLRATRLAQHFTCPTLAHRQLLLYVLYSATATRRA
jgi:hypothetical protein